MMSLSTTSPDDCSSVRRIGRPIIEGYWWSGKFWAIVLAMCAKEWLHLLKAYRAGETSLEETGTSVEDYGGELASWHWRLGGDDGTDGCFCHDVCVCRREEGDEGKRGKKRERRSCMQSISPAV
jgi:hypothetical protein